MEKALQCLSGDELLSAHIFGVRHLSPASAFHLLDYLDRRKPACVLIEGPCDADFLLPHIAGKNVKTPIALLAYTTESPVKTVMYPLSEYSPEYQAIRWAFRNKAEVRFIDLPASAMIRLDNRKAVGKVPAAEHDENRPVDYYKLQARFYDEAARIGDEPDYESFWERNFEHCPDADAFMVKIGVLSEALRESLEDEQWHSDKSGASYNYVREAHMQMMIEQTIAQGFSKDKIVVVTGAYHVRGLTGGTPAMTEAERAALPGVGVRLTLMPYSYYRLSSQSGYGAGNKAPAYFQLLWECLRANDIKRLAPLYLSKLGETSREAGNYNSTANVIEAVRLADSLAFMHGAEIPTLRELHDASVCLLGNGELSEIAEAIARVDVGAAIGELPESAFQTPVQEDMTRLLKALKLEKYKSPVAQDIILDLREKRASAKSESAFLDLNRSIFFNRLVFLGISFAKPVPLSNASAWAEKWVLRWDPETEIETVEASLKGETIQNAAAFTLKESFEASKSLLELAQLMRAAFICNLLTEIPNGLSRLQSLCVDGGNFVELSLTCWEISNIIQYRDVRNLDTSPLLPILEQLFLKAALVMFDGANCDDEMSVKYLEAMDKMHMVSQEQSEHVNDTIWLSKLRETADSDSRNAKVSGAATALLMERNAISDEDLRIEVARRLSYGTPGDLAALWFEGLSARNRYVLLSRINIWKQLDDYLDTLTDTEFRRTLVFLRRAFSGFEPREKNSITEILADFWNVNAGTAGEFLLEELSEGESAQLTGALDELNEFDFGDL